VRRDEIGRGAWGAAVVVAAVMASGAKCAGTGSSAKAPAMAAHEGGPQVGFYRLVFDEYHSLSQPAMQRAAVPWKVIAAAMLAYQRAAGPASSNLPLNEESYAAILSARYGFVVPARVANWPAGEPPPVFRRPIGIVSGTIDRSIPHVELEVSNLGCSTCHAAVLYDAAGNPTRDVWVGLPSSSIDLERYAEEAFAALARAADRPDETLAIIKQVFPSVSQTELATLRRYYFPELGQRMAALRAGLGAFVPYSNGGPGLTNGVATLKLYLGVIDGKRRDPTQVAFTSIPDFGGLRLRPSVLWDGVYAPPGWPHVGPLPAGLTPAAQRDALGGIVSVVTIGTLGVTPDVAASNIPRVREAVGWILDHYEPPPFPGAVDAELARRGGALFAQHCARCHGSYAETPRGLRLERFPNHLEPYDVIDTDPVRALAPAGDSSPNDLVRKTALGPHLDARATRGYIAPPLTSLWATAPYLHNGSVPTLWHLMHPGARPARFEVGGHRLDFAKVGIDGRLDAEGTYRYPGGYRPWTLPEVYDTRTPGRSAAGHLEPFDELGEADKQALLEFPKRV
jgi:mono/diheme cytochrome c family protein